MGFLNKLFGKKDESKESEKAEEKKSEEKPEGKYSEECSLCGGAGTEKKWMGQYWHKKCIRVAKRSAKKMI